MDVSSENRPGRFTPRASPGLVAAPAHLTVWGTESQPASQARAATNRNVPARFVTKAEQRVASGVAGRADGRVFSCQWRLVAESASVFIVHSASWRVHLFECDVTLWLVNDCPSLVLQCERLHESVTLWWRVRPLLLLRSGQWQTRNT
jgi:hypothetical protein